MLLDQLGMEIDVDFYRNNPIVKLANDPEIGEDKRFEVLAGPTPTGTEMQENQFVGLCRQLDCRVNIGLPFDLLLSKSRSRKDNPAGQYKNSEN